MKMAQFYKGEGKHIRCELCPHNCLISDGQSGICGKRINKAGALILEGYGNISSIALDPIEKKPLYHFYPGRDILSIGGVGCNFKCRFCQNWQIAHEDRVSTRYIDPIQIVDQAKELGSFGIAYTYNEPLIGYEYIYDTANIAREKGLKNILVTNGFINTDPLDKLLPYIDAMNIDVKAFNNDFYRKVCAGALPPVKESVERSIKACHVEITTLIINGLNDDLSEIENLAKWISSIDDKIPLHLSRYYPNYQMDIPATSIDTMSELYDIAKKYLHFVYIGNVSGVDNNTYCPNCSRLLIKRGFRARTMGIENGKCTFCGFKLGKNI